VASVEVSDAAGPVRAKAGRSRRSGLLTQDAGALDQLRVLVRVDLDHPGHPPEQLDLLGAIRLEDVEVEQERAVPAVVHDQGWVLLAIEGPRRAGPP
jgi:hypothetical protein